MIKITGFIWRWKIVGKLAWKHHLTVEEVEEVFRNQPRIQRIAKGHYHGEDVYAARGQTNTGRYILVIFIYKNNRQALINTARDMTAKERKNYEKNKRKVEPLPEQFKNFEALADFWDRHDLTDYENQLENVRYAISPKPKRQFVVTLSDELTQAMKRAVQREGVSMQTLVNLWVQERLQRYSPTS